MHTANACNFMRKNDDRCIFCECKKAHFFHEKRNMKAVNFTLACHTLNSIWFWPFFVEKQNVGCISASFVVQSKGWLGYFWIHFEDWLDLGHCSL